MFVKASVSDINLYCVNHFSFLAVSKVVEYLDCQTKQALADYVALNADAVLASFLNGDATISEILTRVMPYFSAKDCSQIVSNTAFHVSLLLSFANFWISRLGFSFNPTNTTKSLAHVVQTKLNVDIVSEQTP